jgi:3-oxoacyl-[acyl-carrier-protein] synthase-3
MLEKNQLTLDHIDIFLLHQGSLHIVNSIADTLGISRDKCPFHSSEYGNTVSSSIPMLLHREFNNQSIKTAVLSGFGVGLSWASTILKRV